MTGNQISYNRLLEDRRHNQAVEIETNRNNIATLEEASRHNRQSEYLQKYGVDSNLRGVIYSANMHYAAAQASAQATKYAADSNKLASKYSADRSYASSLYGTRMSTQASKYASDQRSAASNYAANLSSAASRYGADRSASSRLQQQRETNRTSILTTAIRSGADLVGSVAGLAGKYVKGGK